MLDTDVVDLGLRNPSSPVPAGRPIRCASWSFRMATSPATPSPSTTGATRVLPTRKGSPGWDDLAPTAACPRVLRRPELPVDTTQLARFLIGKMLVRTLAEGIAAGRIVETEAYDIGDPAGHAYHGMTPRNRTLFLERGYAYVYLAYGISFMLNVSSEAPGVGAGVLIRAIEPTGGIRIMQRNRNTERLRDLARGPGRLSAALDIDRRLDGIDLCQTGPLWLGTAHQATGDQATGDQATGEIGQGKRIGITRAPDSPLRFYVRGNLFVSGPRALNK